MHDEPRRRSETCATLAHARRQSPRHPARLRRERRRGRSRTSPCRAARGRSARCAACCGRRSSAARWPPRPAGVRRRDAGVHALETAVWLARRGRRGAARLPVHVLRVRARAAHDRRADHVELGGDLGGAVARDAARAGAPVQLVGAALVVAGAVWCRATRASGERRRRTADAATAPDAAAAVPRWVWASLARRSGFGVLIPAIGRIAPGDRAPRRHARGLRRRHRCSACRWRPGFRIDLAPPPRARLAAVALAGPVRDGRLRLHRARRPARAAGAGLAAGEPRVGVDRALRLGRPARAPAPGGAGRRGAGLRRRHHGRLS